MKKFKPTYLYVKTHNITGLKYFGKTTTNRKRYRGSGTYWLRHLKKHGYDISTEIIGYFINQEECTNFAINFSIENDIVNSRLWANERLENGLDGGDTTSQKDETSIKEIVKKRKQTISKKTPEEKSSIQQKIKDGVKKYIEENPEIRQAAVSKIMEKRRNNGKPWHTADSIQKIKMNNKSGTIEVRQKLSKSKKGKKNPKHSAIMATKTGLLNKNTRLFEITTPDNEIKKVIGFGNVQQYCRDNNLSIEQLMKHLNIGKIETINAKRIYTRMRNCIGYSITEIDRRS
jgi:hypothetical protein